MEYYNQEGELVTFRKEKYKTKGTSAEIYQIKRDLWLKKYKKDASYTARMDYEVFKILKELKHPFTNQVLELLYETDHVYNREKLIHYPNSFQTDAYTYLYLKDRNIDIIKKSVEYFLYNVENLEKLMDIFATEYGMVAADLRRKNALYQEDKIIVFDLDCCKKVDRPKKEILSQNKTELTLLLISLLLASKSSSHQYMDSIKDLLLTKENENVTKVLKRKLAKYKTPLEYIKNR